MEREETSTLMTTDDLVRHLRMSRVTIWRKRAAARAMYGSADQGMCELWKAKHGAKACPVLVPMMDKPKP